MAAVTQNPDDDTWTFVCDACGFTSVGHDSRKAANVRRDDHNQEHEGTTHGDHSH